MKVVLLCLVGFGLLALSACHRHVPEQHAHPYVDPVPPPPVPPVAPKVAKEYLIRVKFRDILGVRREIYRWVEARYAVEMDGFYYFTNDKDHPRFKPILVLPSLEIHALKYFAPGDSLE